MSLSALRLRHFTVFAAVARAASMQAAARSLHLTQPAVSKLIAEIEAQLGAALFERSRRGVSLTECGKAFMHRAELIINEVAAAQEESTAIAAGTMGQVRVGVLPVAAPRIIPATLLRLLKSAPNLSVIIEEGATGTLLDALVRGDLDCVVGRLDPASAGPGLQEERIAQMPIKLVVRHGHPLARIRRPTWRHLAGYRWIAPRKGAPVRTILDNEFAGIGLPPPRPVIESVSARLNCELLCNSDLVGVLGDDAAREYARAKLLAILPVPITQTMPHVGLVTRTGHRARALDTFIAALRAACKAPDK